MNKIIFLIFFITELSAYTQEARGDLRLMFYNVENLFDTQNDPATNDDEFTPEGYRHWNEKRYYSKLNNIFKVIVNVGIWNPPEIIGLCEIENKQVLNDLIFKTPLYKYDYEIIHYNSPDTRGIDAGCIYNKKKLKIINSYPVSVSDEKNKNFKTRDILYASFVTNKNDTLHIYINHWPSRRGGQLQSEDKRILAAKTLINHINLQLSNSKPYIVIMGDFNDDPYDKSVSLLTKKYNDFSLANLSHTDKKNSGTIKYNGCWNLFDQIIVSTFLIDNKNGLSTSYDFYKIFYYDYILTEDKIFSGKKPFKTYYGLNYQNGFSDHLPVALDIWYK